jgi:hypothetical protein
VRQGQRGRGGRERHLLPIDKREREREREKTGTGRMMVGSRGRAEGGI